MSPYAETVLSKLRELGARPDKPVRAGLVADCLGIARRTAYNYLIELESRGLAVKASPKRWSVA
jgi:Mn-dependent DtxR family transcriptional regulator